MNGPARADHCLLVAHHDVARLLRLTHIVHYESIFRQIKIQIHFHSAVVCMAGHRVPYTARLQLCHTHLQLTALYLSRQDVLVDGTLICVFHSTQMLLILVLDDHFALTGSAFPLDQYRGIRGMRRCGVDIKLRRILCIITFKFDILCAHSDIHTVAGRHFIYFAVDRDLSGTADIDHAHFTALEEIFRTQLIPCFQFQLLRNRSRRTGDDTVDVAVHQIDLVFVKHFLDQKFFSQTLCVIVSYILRGCGCSQFHETILLANNRCFYIARYPPYEYPKASTGFAGSPFCFRLMLP